ISRIKNLGIAMWCGFCELGPGAGRQTWPLPGDQSYNRHAEGNPDQASPARQKGKWRTVKKSLEGWRNRGRYALGVTAVDNFKGTITIHKPRGVAQFG